MAIASEDAIERLSMLTDEADDLLKATFQNMHQGHLTHTLMRFLKAREWSVPKAHEMLVNCLNWRVQNQIDDILSKPITPAGLYRGIRESQLIGLSGYSKQGFPVFAIGAGLSTFDKASVRDYVQSHIQINEYRDRVILPAASKKYGRHVGTCYKILDMTGLKFSSLSQIKVVKPLLQERTRRKIQVLQGCGRDELLKIMDYASLPHFCRREGSSCSGGAAADCYSLDHPFHQQLYRYMKREAERKEAENGGKLGKEGSFPVEVPIPEAIIEWELHNKLGDASGRAMDTPS
ncbi:phosphatidylinositol/phosphatidylcholine transfer protein SFH9-like isoform X2 [Musa acuminata AAA Group]|uniref:phosphatidylinositol/phosphatidylcholine transfer protein SFH9-like isoform X2 n=1 Tax=Musa acuminata AAA Group TaxID=214697 RepID=UPI0031D35AAF